MFKGFILSLLMVVGFQTAQATSLHPCTFPYVDAQPSILNCSKMMKVKSADGNQQVSRVYYTITLNTKMSKPGCSEKHEEITRASIKISVDQAGEVGTIELQPGSFSYKLGDSFSSAVLGLDLKKCVTPMNGGFSVGN